MLAPTNDLLRAGLKLKLNQINRATRSYLRDRTDQATGTVASYAVAAGMFAAAGIFLIAACLVGAVALFDWIEINYGTFEAFGAVGTLLLLIATVCAAVAAAKLKPPARVFPSLTSRLRVAIKASPIRSGQIEATPDTALVHTPATPMPRGPKARYQRSQSDLYTGLILMMSLVGWAAIKQRQQARRPAV